MDLPDLAAGELLLALDLVAGWQIEKVKEEPIYFGWPEASEIDIADQYMLTGDATNLRSIPGCRFEETYLRSKLHNTGGCYRELEGDDHGDDSYEEHEGYAVRGQYEIEWANGQCHLLFYPDDDVNLGIHATGIPEIPARSRCNENGCSDARTRSSVCRQFGDIYLQY